MFFETESFNVNILSVLELEWPSKVQNSDTRPFHALSFRIQGDAEFISKGGITNAKTGDILFAPKYLNYKLNCGNEHLFVIHFDTKDVLPPFIKVFTPENQSYYYRKFNDIYTAWTKKQFGYVYECNSIFYRILSQIEQEYMHTNYYVAEERLKEAVEYIHDNFTKNDFSIDDLARFCNMSGTYFRKLFMNEYCASPRAYINKLKLQYALELLNSGYYTVSEVSDKCGFKNIYYFSSFIKKHTGVAPSKI